MSVQAIRAQVPGDYVTRVATYSKNGDMVYFKQGGGYVFLPAPTVSDHPMLVESGIAEISWVNIAVLAENVYAVQVYLKFKSDYETTIACCPCEMPYVMSHWGQIVRFRTGCEYLFEYRTIPGQPSLLAWIKG